MLINSDCDGIWSAYSSHSYNIPCDTLALAATTPSIPLSAASRTLARITATLLASVKRFMSIYPQRCAQLNATLVHHTRYRRCTNTVRRCAADCGHHRCKLFFTLRAPTACG